MFLQPDDLGTALNEIIADAMPRLTPLIAQDWGHGEAWRLSREEVEVGLWVQSWSDTSCGFGGMAGQALSSAYTVLVSQTGDAPFVVYHNFRFAYAVLRPTSEFYRKLERRQLPGAHDRNLHAIDRAADGQP